MFEEDDLDCSIPMKRFCITWKVKEHFARDQFIPFQGDNIEINVIMHYLSSNTTNHGVESGWKATDLDREFLVQPVGDSSALNFWPLQSNEVAVVLLDTTVALMEYNTPVPVLMFFKASIIGINSDMFVSSPLVAFIPKSPDLQQVSVTKIQCNNICIIIPTLDGILAHRVPYPATMGQAFLDPSLIFDPGCIVNPANLNKAFNWYLNHGAKQCFLQR